MATEYVLKPTSDEQYLFNLQAATGQVILISERYTGTIVAQTIDDRDRLERGPDDLVQETELPPLRQGLSGLTPITHSSVAAGSYIAADSSRS